MAICAWLKAEESCIVCCCLDKIIPIEACLVLNLYQKRIYYVFACSCYSYCRVWSKVIAFAKCWVCCAFAIRYIIAVCILRALAVYFLADFYAALVCRWICYFILAIMCYLCCAAL